MYIIAGILMGGVGFTALVLYILIEMACRNNRC